MNKHLFTMGFLLTVSVCAFLLVLATEAGAVSRNCGAPGVWFGEAVSGHTWMNVVSRGSSATVGQFSMEWVIQDPTLGGMFPSAVRVSDAAGVWEKVQGNLYQFTWVDYAFDAGGGVLYSVRCSGTRWFVDCDHAEFAFVLEIFLAGQDTPIACVPGTGTETRMQVVQAVCEE